MYEKRYMKACITNELPRTLLFQEKKIPISLQDSLVRRTLATSPRPIQFDRRPAPLSLWLSEALPLHVQQKASPPAHVSPLGQTVLFAIIG